MKMIRAAGTRAVVAVTALLATTALVTAAANAETLKWAASGDSLTLDPHAQNEGPTHTIAHQHYEPLLHRDHDLQIIPALATGWAPTDDPTVWEFTLRQGVTFHDGSAFDADDVVFSLNRARHPNADMKGLLSTITEVRWAGPYSVHIHTDGPNPLLPNNLTNLFIIDRDWAVTHGVTTPQDFKASEETHAVRHANGTGAFRLVSREADVKTVWERNDAYWGKDSFPLEITRMEFTPIQNGATRIAALLSGELDLVLEPPVQDLGRIDSTAGVKLASTPQNRVIFLGMNQGKADLEFDTVSGRNPFAEKKVRQAMHMAINRDAIQKVVMRGQSRPTGIIAPPFVNGWTEAHNQYPAPDAAAATALMAEAGYGDGFQVTLHCPNDRYINDEAICQAVVGMLGRIGITVDLVARPKSIHFKELQNGGSEFYMLGWGVPTFDSHYIFHYLAETRTDDGGAWNFTGFSDARLDALVKAMTQEVDPDKRNAMLADAWTIVQDGIPYLPIHNQVVNWAMKDRVDFPAQGENQPHFKFLRFN